MNICKLLDHSDHGILKAKNFRFSHSPHLKYNPVICLKQFSNELLFFLFKFADILNSRNSPLKHTNTPKYPAEIVPLLCKQHRTIAAQGDKTIPY